MIQVFNEDNLMFSLEEHAETMRPDIIYADCVYENHDFTWVNVYWEYLKKGGVFIIQTDWHTNFRYRAFMEDYHHAYFVNELVWKNEWGNHPKNKFHQCYDSILIYSNTKDWNFNPDAVQVPKVTINKGLNPSGRQTKQATAWIDDICLTTTSNERIKKSDGHLAKWQKPMKLYDRIIAPFITYYSFILDPFMGVGTLGRWCARHPFPWRLNYFGIEIDKETYSLAIQNIQKGIVQYDG